MTDPTTHTDAILDHIKQAGKDEIIALKPQIAKIIREFVAKYEDAHMTGFVGKIERHVVDAVLNSIFGPA